MERPSLAKVAWERLGTNTQEQLRSCNSTRRSVTWVFKVRPNGVKHKLTVLFASSLHCPLDSTLPGVGSTYGEKSASEPIWELGEVWDLGSRGHHFQAPKRRSSGSDSRAMYIGM